MKSKKQKKKPSQIPLLTSKALDLLIVIAGVTIAFQFGRLKEASDERSLEKFYLESMANDLNRDIDQYRDNLQELQIDQKMVLGCLRRMERKESVADSIGLTVVNVLNFKTFEGNRNTFSTIISSNGLSLLSDTAIRNMMLEHYRLYDAISRFEENYRQHTSKMRDYFGSYIDYYHPQVASGGGYLQLKATKNLLTTSANRLQDGMWRYGESIEKAEQLRDRIRDYLAR